LEIEIDPTQSIWSSQSDRSNEFGNLVYICRPSNNKKTPDLLDFEIIKGIVKDYYRTESCLELSSDHSPIIFTINSKIVIKGKVSK